MSKNKKNRQKYGPQGFPGSRPPSAATVPPPSPTDSPTALDWGDGLQGKTAGEIVGIAMSDTADDPLRTDAVAFLPGPAGAAVAEGAGTDASPEVPSREALVEAIRRLRQERRLFEFARQELTVAKARHDRAVTDAETRAAGLEERESLLRKAEDDLAARKAADETSRIELLKLEAAAKAGFPDLLKDWREAEQRDLETRERDLTDRRVSLEESLQKFAADRKILRDERLKLDSERECLEERLVIERKRAELQATESHAQQIEGVRLRAEALERQLEAERASHQSTKDVLAKAGGRTIEDIVGENGRLRAENDRLERAIISRPSEETAERYRQENEKLRQQEGEHVRTLARLRQLEAELAKARIAVTEFENLTILNRSLESQRQLLLETNRKLESDLTGFLGQREAATVFRCMSEMDGDAALQAPAIVVRSGVVLSQIVTRAQARMATDHRKPLHYDLPTLRCFLAGMAMSRLHILQGISGTGKTSLPVAFAEALGGRSDNIAVQAGWRDRQDLLGYFNSFDKRYHETDFVQALYRAQCPQWQDRICLVVLDEMNLSSVEQFGADLLSQLESPHPDGPRLSLLDAPAGSPPRLLKEARAIALPSNVWFIGTANRDETTRDFADKSYSRSHTMELPRNRKEASYEPPPRTSPLSSAHLQELFERARVDRKADGERAMQCIESLAVEFRDGFDIVLDNRFETHVGKYVPVVVDAGGTVAEAVDHLLATKLLRRLEHRHNVRIAQLESLRTRIDEMAERSRFPKDQFGKCAVKLSSMIRDKKFDETGGA
jgi:hypothetical protein